MLDPTKIDLTVSIVSHNNREMLKECLVSIFSDPMNIPASDGSLNLEIVVVLNVPGDGSADMLRASFPGVKIIENQTPAGFSANHNRALRGARGDYLIILNDDVIVHPGCFAELLHFLRSHPDAGAAGPRTLNTDGSLQVSCFRLPTLAVLFHDAFFLSSFFPSVTAIGGYKAWAHDATREVGHILGACMAVPRQVFEAAGGFDERFFLYYEEADLCKRIRESGKKIFFHPDAVITHHGGATISRLGDEANHNFRTGLNTYYAKHFGRASLAGVYTLNMYGAAVRLAIYAVMSPFSKNLRDVFSEPRRRYGAILKWYVSSIFGKRKTKQP